MFPRAKDVTFYFSSIFFKQFISITSYIIVLNFKAAIINISSVCNNILMEQSESSRKESNITFPPMKTGTANVNLDRERFSPVNSSSNAEPGYCKNFRNDDLISSISALVNTRLTEFRSTMITMVNKNGAQSVSFRR